MSHLPDLQTKCCCQSSPRKVSITLTNPLTLTDVWLNSWHFYREGTLALYNRNMVTFDNFGSDLQTMCKSWNDLGVQSPIFGEVTLIIGDHVSQDNGFLKACSFANVLQHLKTPLRVQRLIIILERYHLSTREQFASFAATFMNVKVGNHLMLATTLIPALPFCWEFMTLQLTGAMHMDYTALERIPGSAIGDPDARTAIFGRTKVWEQGEAGVEH